MTPEREAALRAAAERGQVPHACGVGTGHNSSCGDGADCVAAAVRDLIVEVDRFAAAVRDLLAEVDRLAARAERSSAERAAALTVHTKEGMLASEWLLRTGLAEQRALRAELQRPQGDETPSDS